MTLFCVFCHHLPWKGRTLDNSSAWTVVNGYATCARHVEFARMDPVWRTLIPKVIAWEQAMGMGLSEEEAQRFAVDEEWEDD